MLTSWIFITFNQFVSLLEGYFLNKLYNNTTLFITTYESYYVNKQQQRDFSV